MAKTCGTVMPYAFPVGPAVRDRPRHGDEQITIDRSLRIAIVIDSCDTTHQQYARVFSAIQAQSRASPMVPRSAPS